MNNYYVIKTQEGQSVIDIAISHYGCFEGVYAILEDNEFLSSELTAVFPAFYEIKIREDVRFLSPEKRDYAKYMRSIGMNINTHNLSTLPQVNHEGESNAYLPDVLIMSWDWLAKEKQVVEIDANYSGTFNTLVLHTNVFSASFKLNSIVVAPPFNLLAGDELEITIVRIDNTMKSIIMLKQ